LPVGAGPTETVEERVVNRALAGYASCEGPLAAVLVDFPNRAGSGQGDLGAGFHFEILTVNLDLFSVLGFAQHQPGVFDCLMS